MVLSVSISSEAEAKLKAKAVAAGVDVSTYASRELERAVSRRTLEEILAPLRADFEASGMTEDELVELLEQVKHEVRAETRDARKSS